MKGRRKEEKHFCGPSSLWCLLFCLLLPLTLFCSHPDTVYPYIFISKSISHQQLEHKQGKDPPTPPGLFENGNVYSLHNVWGRAESSLNPELHFNLIEACHQISGLCFQWWAQPRRRHDNKRQDYSVFTYFCLKMVKHGNLPAVWWFQTRFEKGGKDQSRGSKFFVYFYVTLAKIRSQCVSHLWNEPLCGKVMW